MKSVKSAGRKVIAVMKSAPFIWRAARFHFLILTVILIVQGLSDPYAAWLLGHTLHDIQSGSLNVLTTTFLWLLIFVSDAGLYPVIYHISNIVNEKISIYVHEAILQRSLAFETSEKFEDKSFYDGLNVLLEEPNSRPTNYIVLYTYLIRAIINIVSFSILLGKLNPCLGIMVIVAELPITRALERMRVANWTTIKNARTDMRYMQSCCKVATSKASFQEFKSYQGEPFIFALFNKHKHAYLRARKASRKVSLQKCLGPLALGLGLYGLSVVILCQSIRTSTLDLGDFGSILAAYISLRAAVSALSQNITYISEKAYYFEDLLHYLELPKDVQGSELLPSADALTIRFDHVSFSYPQSAKPALEDVSFTLSAKETLVICGENGAGKSTLLKLLLGFYRPSAGKIFINGIDMQQLSLSAYRSYVGALFQDFTTLPVTCAENVAYREAYSIDTSRLARVLQRLFGSDQRILPDELLDKSFGGRDLSGGEAQRLALARAFYKKDTRLIVMDEPTTAIDPMWEAAIFSYIGELAKTSTSVIISHRLGVSAYADKVFGAR